MCMILHTIDPYGDLILEGLNLFEELEKRVQRLERLIYLLIGLQIPDLLPYLGVL